MNMRARVERLEALHRASGVDSTVSVLEAAVKAARKAGGAERGVGTPSTELAASQHPKAAAILRARVRAGIA